VACRLLLIEKHSDMDQQLKRLLKHMAVFATIVGV
jgi:hypothetical protein